MSKLKLLLNAKVHIMRYEVRKMITSKEYANLTKREKDALEDDKNET